MAAEIRNQMVKVGYTKQELKAITAKAKQDGLSLAAWIRNLTVKAAKGD